MEEIFELGVSHLTNLNITEIMCELGPKSTADHDALLRQFAALLPRRNNNVGYPPGRIAHLTCDEVIRMWGQDCPEKATIGAFVKILQREEFKECHEVLLPTIKKRFRMQ